MSSEGMSLMLTFDDWKPRYPDIEAPDADQWNQAIRNELNLTRLDLQPNQVNELDLMIQ